MNGRIPDTAAPDLDPIELGRRVIVLSPHLWQPLPDEQYEAACFSRRIGLYVEQPYGLGEDGVGLPEQLRDLTPGTVKRRGTRICYRELFLKILASRAYTSQLAVIPHRVIWPMSRYEMVSGEVVALLEPR